MSSESALRGGQVARTVLVVEDESFLRSAIVGALRREGYHVVEARDADEARQVLQPGGEVDLVFTDVHMPGEETGLDLAQWINEAFPRIAVLLTSGQVSAAQVGGRPFLRKPYRSRQVLLAIQQLLGG